jgi:hypothetical protein
MRKIIVSIIAALIVFIVSDDGGRFALAKAGPHVGVESMAITYSSSFTAYFNPWGYVIEQQSPQPDYNVDPPVVNPTNPKMLWDVDDLRQFIASGSLAAGESYSISVPAILDNGGHFLVVQGNAGNKGGTLSLSIPELGYTYSRAIGRDGDRWCMAGPFFDLSDPRLSPIDGSNGGVGVVANYVWTVTANANAHSAGLNAQVFYGSLAQQDALCGGHNWSSAGLLALVGP